MTCQACKQELGPIAGYTVTHLATVWDFCSRRCLIDYLAPELNKVAVVRQWIPNEEETQRMHE